MGAEASPRRRLTSTEAHCFGEPPLDGKIDPGQILIDNT